MRSRAFWWLCILAVSFGCVAALTYRHRASQPLALSPGSGKPVLVCTEEVNLGEQERGEYVKACVTLANQGDADLMIDGIRASCACAGLERETSAGYARVEQLMLRPHESSELVVRLAVNGVPAEQC